MSVFQDAIANLLSPIADLLKDSSVSEIMINGPHEIFIERNCQALLSKLRISAKELIHELEKELQQSGS